MHFFELIKTTGEKVIINFSLVTNMEEGALGTILHFVDGTEVYVRNKIEASCGTLNINFAK